MTDLWRPVTCVPARAPPGCPANGIANC